MTRIVLFGSLCFFVNVAFAQSPAASSPAPEAAVVEGDEDPYQAVYVAKEVADAAAALVKVGDTVRDFCGYCKEKEPGFTTHEVETVMVEQDDESDKYALSLNGVDVDLASIHVKQGEQWKNLAVLVKAEVKDVPESLPADVTELKEEADDDETTGASPSPSPAGN